MLVEHPVSRGVRPGLRRLVGPRPWVLLVAFLLVFGLFGAFAYAFLSSQSNSRAQAERAFATEARTTSRLTGSLFTSSAASSEAAAAQAFPARVPSGQALTALARRAHLVYAAILDGKGRVLRETAGAPAGLGDRAGSSVRHVREALAGHAWLSNLLPGGASGRLVIEWALPFESPFGRRVELEAFDARTLSKFLRGYLREPDKSQTAIGYVVDARGRIIADSSGVVKLGQPLPRNVPTDGVGQYRSGGVDRYMTAAPLEGSGWRVLLSEPTATVYPALAGTGSWILYAALAAFGLVGVLTLVLLRRMLFGTARVVETNRELAELNATLEARVAQRTAVAEQRAEELARSNSELEEFASVASHDLQEPLRKIRMYCERLPRRLGEGVSAEVASDLERIQDAAARMQRLIDDLLSFARVASRERKFELVDLNEVALEVVGDLEARVAELGAAIEVGELPVVEADRAQISQLLQNLVSNALKFHREGVTPTVRIRSELRVAEPPRFGAESRAGNRCLITVEDNGIGFDPKYAEKVFSAFERLHGRSTYEGTGIGLSIARKIAWRHRWELTAASTPGLGSTFTLSLPHPGQDAEPIEEAA